MDEVVESEWVGEGGTGALGKWLLSGRRAWTCRWVNDWDATREQWAARGLRFTGNMKVLSPLELLVSPYSVKEDFNGTP